MNHPQEYPAQNGPRQDLQPAENARQLQPAGILPPTSAGEPDDDIIYLREYWRILVRRKWTIFTAIVLAVILALLATFNATPIYRSTLLLQIDRTGNRVVDYGSVEAEDRGYFADQNFYTTQYELLKSRSLARRVIDQLGLQTEDQQPEQPSFLADMKANLKAMLSALSGSEDKATEASAESTELDKRKAEEAALLNNLSVEPVRDSRLVNISFDSPSPTEAATVANAIAANFISMNLERRYDASSYAKEFLQDQLAQMRATLEASERRFVQYAREREIVNLDDRLEIVLDKLREMNTKLVSAEAERIAAESEYMELMESSDGSIADVLDNELIQSLKERRGDLQAEYQEKLQVYKPGYPAMQQLQRRIDELGDDIAGEIASIRASVKSRYEAKVREEAKLTQRISELKDEALTLQDRSTDYETLKREVETNRELYDGLLQRMKEVGVAAGVGENNISIVDAATVPAGPYKPSLAKNLAIAIALGSFFGVGLAFLLEMLDDTVKTAEDVEKRVGAPLLGQIPKASAREHGIAEAEIPLLAFKDPKSAVAEAVRSLRTSLLFSTAEGAPRVMHLTSSSPSEGKTMTAVSLAITFAQAGNKVLLIDGDLRNPSLHRIFRLPNATGLTNHLAGDADPADIAQPTQVTRLFTITSGPMPPNPVELLSGAKMLDLLSLAAERFDHVVLDGPPVIGLADALVLANLAKTTIFIVEPGETRTHEIDAAIKRLRQANARILGATMSKVSRAGKGYGYGYGYDYKYLYTYGGKRTDAALAEPERT